MVVEEVPQNHRQSSTHGGMKVPEKQLGAKVIQVEAISSKCLLWMKKQCLRVEEKL